MVIFKALLRRDGNCTRFKLAGKFYCFYFFKEPPLSGSRAGYKHEKRKSKITPQPSSSPPTLNVYKDLNTKENNHTPVLAILISGFPALSFFFNIVNSFTHRNCLHLQKRPPLMLKTSTSCFKGSQKCWTL